MKILELLENNKKIILVISIILFILFFMSNNYYRGNKSLNYLMNKYGSDKGTDHNYTFYYEKLFSHNKQEIKSLCEIGLGTNDIDIPSNMGVDGKPLASLYAWRDYFNNATIYGGDIDEKILKNEERIFTYKIDMTDKNSIKRFWKNIDTPVDIIIDDGLHEYDANVTLFENSIDMWKHYYIIEDVKSSLLHKWGNKINEWRNKYPSYNIEIVRLKIKTNRPDNNLIVIRKG